MMDATAVRQISNVDGSIYLFDLYKDKNSFYYQPCLVFEKAKFETVWDNEDYVFNFMRKLLKNKKSAQKELKKYCKEAELNFESTRQDLIDIFKTSKQLKFWKIEKKQYYQKKNV